MSAEINKPGTRGLNHIVKAAGYSMKGLKAAITHEEAFRLELLAMVVMLPLAIWLGQGAVEKALLIGSLLLVLVVELINSATYWLRAGSSKPRAARLSQAAVSSGVTVSLVAAIGRIALQVTPYLPMSRATVLVKPTIPSLAAL